MYRRNYRSFRNRNGKYSNETVALNSQVTETIDGNVTFPKDDTEDPPLHQTGLVIVPSTSILGNRKVKNFTIKITANGNDDSIFGALVYVPEGTRASDLQVAGSVQSMYEPNQNVICTFVIPPNVEKASDATILQQGAPTQITVSNRLARNLNTGDYIALIFSSPNGITNSAEHPTVISGTVNFAIKY